MLVDTHCHLDFNSFNPDRKEVINRARDAGLVRMLNPGIDLKSSMIAINLAENYSEIYAAVGVHPNEALSWERDTLANLRNLADHPKVVAIGEIGLDYYRDRAPQDVQTRVFREQLNLAAELGLPVIIHSRQASEDVVAILAEWCDDLKEIGSSLDDRPGVLHSFSERQEVALRAIELGFYIGFTGPVTYRNAADIQGAASAISIEKMLIETDSPFLAPQQRRGTRNEPALVRLVAEKIAELRNIDLETVSNQTTANASWLFSW